MALSIVMIVLGLIILMWSADLFVDGAATVAKLFGMSSLLVGMIVVGFGTSAPEMSVSVLSALQGNPGIALGNAYGSNITNIALILGLTAIFSPLLIKSRVVRKELPMLMLVTLVACFHLYDGKITRIEGFVELLLLAGILYWMTKQGMNKPPKDALAKAIDSELAENALSPAKAWLKLVLGLVLLVVSSRMLVWGAVNIAQTLGVSDLIIGLTVVAIGTSLPELAASIAAVRKGEHDLAVGNVVGSNFFNTLAVVGLAGAIHPMQVPAEVLTRDWLVMMVLTMMLFAFGYSHKAGEEKTIKRAGGVVFVTIYIGYTLYLIASVLKG